MIVAWVDLLVLISTWPVVTASQTMEIILAVKTPGVANTMYKTDVVLGNLGAGDAACTLTLLDPSNPASLPVAVPEGEGVVAVEDVYEQLLPGVWGQGGLLVECAGTVGVTSRIYAELQIDGSDLRGQCIHGLGSSSHLTASNPLSILGLSQNASYRSNLTLVNAGSADVTVTTTRDATGASQSALVAAGSMLTINNVLDTYYGASDTSDESLTVSVAAGGPVAAWAMLVNLASGDFATLAGQASTGMASPLVIPALRNGSGLVTDLDLRNPAASPESITLTHSSGASAGFAIAAGTTAFDDVLAMLGVSEPFGVLQISAANPILAQGRYRTSGTTPLVAALPARVNAPSTFMQRVGALPGVTSATTILYSPDGSADGYLTMAPPAVPQPLPARVLPYLVATGDAAIAHWRIAASSGASIAELTTDNSRAVLSFLVSARNPNDIILTPFFTSGVPRPFIQESSLSCETGGSVFTFRPDWPGLVWEWYAGGVATGVTTKTIDATAGVVYRVHETDPFFASLGRSRDASPTPLLFCDGFESGDLSGWAVSVGGL